MTQKLTRKTLILLTVLGIVILGSAFSLRYLHRLFPEDSDIGKDLFALGMIGSDIIKSADTHGQKLVALTFDDGPDPRFTPVVLKILKEHNAKATFFVVGKAAEANPELIHAQEAMGCEIENHTYTHPDLLKDSQYMVSKEIAMDQNTIVSLTNSAPTYFRPPKALFNQQDVETAEKLGLKVVLWGVCVEHHRSKTPKAMALRVVRKVHPGMIILAHDGRLDRTKTMKALPIIIEKLQAQGYKFVTLNELLNVQGVE